MRKLLLLLAFVLIFLTACNQSAEIKITFVENGGVELEDITIKTTDTSVEIPETTRAGYTFEGWYTDPELTIPFTIASLLSQSGAITLYAKWTELTNAFTVTYQTNGGSPIEPASYDSGSTVIEPTDPTKEGYTFVGWYTDENLETAYTFGPMPEADLTLYAKWSINQYTITFESNGGTDVTALSSDYQASITKPVNPSKTGYTFVDWYSDIALTIPYVFTQMGASNITLYAKWSVNQYTITFESNGGSSVTALTSDYQGTITKPTNPTKVGYTFENWYTDTGLNTAYVFSTMGSSNITLYAKWTLNQYAVNFETNGGSVITSIQVNHGGLVSEPTAPTKLGHAFNGWYSDNNFNTPYVFSTVVTQSLILYAKWTVNPYTLSFNANGGADVAAITQNFGTVVTLPTTTKLGYDFAGWYSNPELTTVYASTAMPGENKTLYAKWTASPYTITFESNGGSIVTSISANYNETIQSPTNPSKQGHTFVGWFSDSALNTPFIFDKMPVGGASLYAKWSVNNYTISYIINGSSINVEIAYQGQITLMNAPAQEGYTFTGWLENNEPFALTIMPNRNITLLPKYEAKTYVISFGNIDKDDMLVKFNELIVIPEPTLEGYIFDGWYSDELLLNEFEDTPMGAENITLYAKFEPLEVALYLHVDELTVENLQIEYQEVFVLEIPVKEGYQFLGWYLEDTFSTRVYEIKMDLTAIHLYAQWRVDEGYELIETLLMTEPEGSVKVKGIISYIFEKPGFPGFYLYDGTASIFVLASPAPFVVGNVIEFEATYDNFENTPQLINPIQIIASTGTYELPETNVMSLENIMRLDETNPFVYGQIVTVEGLLGYLGGSFFLRAPFSDERVMINYRSISSDAILMPYVGQTVRIDVLIHDYQGMASVWHVAYIPNSVNTVSYTPEEIIDMMIELGQQNLEGMIFYPGSTLELPTLDPTYGAILEWSVVGDSSAFFDINTFTFLETDIERQIGLNCVITYLGVTDTATFTVTLRPVTFMSYVELFALEVNGYAMIQGVVLAHIPMIPATIVSVDGNPVFVPNATIVNPGDEVIFAGYKQTEMGLLILANDPLQTLIEVTKTGLPIPPPNIIPLDVFTSLPGDNPLYWFKYVQLTGTLQFDSNSGFYFIVEAGYAVPLLPLVETDNISTYIGMIVSITGFTIMNFDEGGLLHLGYLNMPGDIVVEDMETADKIDVIFYHIFNQFVHRQYLPGDTIDFPTTDPNFGSVITFKHILDSANYINLTTGLISDSIDTFLAVELEVEITLEGVTVTYPVYVHIDPNKNIVDIITLQTMPITEVTMEVIVLTEPANGFVIVGDSTGFMGLSTNRTDIHIGDRLQIRGQLISLDTNMFNNIQNDPIVSIIDSGNADPTLSIPITVSDYLALPLYLLAYQYRAYEVTGLIGYDNVNNTYFLVDEGSSVAIMGTTPEAMMALHDQINNLVTMKGYGLRSDYGNKLLFVNGSGDLEVSMTPEMIVEAAKQSILNAHTDIYRPGESVNLENWFEPFYPNVNYTLISNGDLFDLYFETISPDITVSTFIEFEVTIYYEDYMDVFTLILHVEPLEFSTVEEVKLATEGSELNLEAIVLFNSRDSYEPFMIVRDETGYIIITGQHFYDIYDKVQFTGLVIDYHGEPALEVEAYNTLFISSWNTLLNDPVPMTLLEASLVDATDPLFTYIVITGTIKRDTTAFVLYDANTLEEVYFADIDNHDVFYDYIGLQITFKAFIGYHSDKGAPVLYYSGGHDGIQLTYATDAEKMDILIQKGSQHFEETIYHPFETIEMPTYYALFDAYLTYDILSGSEYLVDGLVQYVETGVMVSLQITILIGTLEEVVVYTITVEPYDIIDIIDVSLNDDGTLVAIKGTVRAIFYNQAIIEDATGMIVIEGFALYQVGDVVLVYGEVNYVFGSVTIYGTYEKSILAVIGTDLSEPILQAISLYDTALLDPNGANLSFYTTYNGVIENREGTFYITNGAVSVQLNETSDDAHQTLLSLENQLVSIQVYFVGLEQYDELYIIALFNGFPTEYEIIHLSDEEIAIEMLNYTLTVLDHPYYTEQTYAYPLVHPYFMGLIQITNDGVYSNLISFESGLATVSEITESKQTDITVTVTYEGISYSDSLTLTLTPFPIVTLTEGYTTYLGELVFLDVIVTSMQHHYDTFIYVQDDSGIGYYITWNEIPFLIGDRIVISCYVYEPMDGVSYLGLVSVHANLGSVVMPESIQVSIEDLVIEAEINYSLLGQLITFSGVVVNNEVEILIQGATVQVELFGNVLPEYQALHTLNGDVVEITGVLIGYYVDYFTQRVMPRVGFIQMNE